MSSKPIVEQNNQRIPFLKRFRYLHWENTYWIYFGFAGISVEVTHIQNKYPIRPTPKLRAIRLHWIPLKVHEGDRIPTKEFKF